MPNQKQTPLFVLAISLWLAAPVSLAAPGTGTGTAWLINSPELEREWSSSSPQESTVLRSPAYIGHQYNQQVANGRSSQLFSRNNGRHTMSYQELKRFDQFQCANPTRGLYENFARQYNRTFYDSEEKIERIQLFQLSMKRAILFNRVVQNAILTSDTLEARNYHFIEPVENQNLALWYADVTDCELALIKNIIFDMFHFINNHQQGLGLKKLQDIANYDLPGLLNEDGMEQLVNILLVRLFDRLSGDVNMNRLFEWPNYVKQLASFAYSQQQTQQPDFKTKLTMVAFAYPSYFKDVKYNYLAVNRTNDNLRAHQAHLIYNQQTQRRPMTPKVQNRRLSFFRQRWSLINQLNEELKSELNDSSRYYVPDWLRTQYDFTSSQETISTNQQSLPLRAASDFSGASGGKAYKLTQFSDLSDAEFQAFLGNDYSLLQGNKESAEFLEQNFAVVPLTDEFRWEIAHELELRHGLQAGGETLELLRLNGELQQQQSSGFSQTSTSINNNNNQHLRPSLRLARQVVDELISDVGLPIGPVALEGVTEEELLRVFQNLTRLFAKTYSDTSRGVSVLEERRLRLELFRENYPRFMAWTIKEGWQLAGDQKTSLLRLADMSWLEIKLTMFKICCLARENILDLGTNNATLHYLSSNYDLLCGGGGDSSTASDQSPQQSAKLQSKQSIDNELTDTEIYYYYLVHFNKHHQNRAEFARRFAIFRKNIESIRRLSCKRSLTLFESLKDMRMDRLNTIDVLDTRRIHSDDLNLDRFEYFRLPRSDLMAVTNQQGAFSGTSQRQQAVSRSDPTRAGFSYQRNHFYPLLNRDPNAFRTSGQLSGDPQVVYMNKLVDSWESVDEAVNKYRENQAGRIYDLVMSHYKWCKKTFEGTDLGSRNLRQQCHSNGPLSDQAALVSSNLFNSDVYSNGQEKQFERLQQDPKMSCDRLYRNGLETFNTGVLPQDQRSVQLILDAHC